MMRKSSRRKTISRSDLESFLCDISDDNIQNDENKCNSLPESSETKGDFVKEMPVTKENIETTIKSKSTPCKKIDITPELKKSSPIIEVKANSKLKSETKPANQLTRAIREFYMCRSNRKVNDVLYSDDDFVEMGREIFNQTGYNALPDRKMFPDKFLDASGKTKDSQCVESKRTVLLNMSSVLTLAEADRKKDTTETEEFTRCKVLKTRSGGTQTLLQKHLTACKLSQPLVESLNGAVYCYQDADNLGIVSFKEYELRYMMYLDSKAKYRLNRNGDGSEDASPVSPFSKSIPKSPVCCNENGVLLHTDDKESVGYATCSTGEPEVEIDLVELDYSNMRSHNAEKRSKGKANNRRYTLSPTTSKQELLACCNEDPLVEVDVESSASEDLGSVGTQAGSPEAFSNTVQVAPDEVLIRTAEMNTAVLEDSEVKLDADDMQSLAFDMCQTDVVIFPTTDSPLPSLDGTHVVQDGSDSAMMFVSEYREQTDNDVDLELKSPLAKPLLREDPEKIECAPSTTDFSEVDVDAISTEEEELVCLSLTPSASPPSTLSRKRSRDMKGPLGSNAVMDSASPTESMEAYVAATTPDCLSMSNPFSPSPGALRCQMVHKMNTSIANKRQSMDVTDLESLLDDEEECLVDLKDRVEVSPDTGSVGSVIEVNTIMHDNDHRIQESHVPSTLIALPISTVCSIPVSTTEFTCSDALGGGCNEKTEENTEESAYYRYMIRMEICKWKYHWELCSQDAAKVAIEKCGNW